MRQGARVVAETQGRQGKVNSANNISHAVLVFVICEAAMKSVPAVCARIRLVEKLKKKGSLVRYQERDKNKIFRKI